MAVIFAASVLIFVLAERAYRIFKPRPSPLDHPAIFFLVVCGAILVLHSPEILFPQAINYDEAQMLAQAMRYCAHPVPWRDVDGTTGGPLNSLLLSVPLHLGAPATWQTARILLWAANSLTLVFLYLAMRVFGTRLEAQFVLAPTILFYAFALGSDFTHYSSETLPVLLLSAGACLLAREWDAPRPSRIRLLLLGLVSGSLPFTKLQAAPLGVFLFVIALAQLVAHRKSRPQEKFPWPSAGALFLGAAVAGLWILVWVAASGAFSDFWISYILAGRSYAQEVSAAERNSNVLRLFAGSSDFEPYFLDAHLTLALLLGGLFLRTAKLGGRLFWPLLVVLAQGVLTVLCVVMAGKDFPHYTLLLVPALAAFLGLTYFAGRRLLGAGAEQAPGPLPRKLRWFLGAYLVVLLVQMLQPVQYVHDFGAAYPPVQSTACSAIAARVRAAATAGDTMSVWGWMPSCYVETGLMPATRDAIGHYVISAGPHRDYFRNRYLSDLKGSRPAFFIDAVSNGAFLWSSWRPTDVHESFPELAAFVDENYSLWWTIHLKPDGVPLRIYLLKSRMAELHLSPGNVETFIELYPSPQSH